MDIQSEISNKSTQAACTKVQAAILLLSVIAALFSNIVLRIVLLCTLLLIVTSNIDICNIIIYNVIINADR